MTKTIVRALTALTLLAAIPGGAPAQTVGDLIRALEAGGGWVGIDLQNGEGSLESGAVPTMGLGVRGCIRVWEGHSGRFDIRARDLLGDHSQRATVVPGESVPFDYRAGRRAKLRVDVEWSEPRDTTLYLWVGLERRSAPSRGEVCTPAESGEPAGP